jgi:hypothetical protein
LLLYPPLPLACLLVLGDWCFRLWDHLGGGGICGNQCWTHSRWLLLGRKEGLQLVQLLQLLRGPPCGCVSYQGAPSTVCGCWRGMEGTCTGGWVWMLAPFLILPPLYLWM